MTQQTEAMRLADALDLYATGDKHQKDIEDAAAELRRLEAVNAQLLEALEATTAMLDRSDCLTGYCCCGSPIDGHGFGDGHTPTDEGAYHQTAALGQARAAIAAAKDSNAA